MKRTIITAALLASLTAALLAAPAPYPVTVNSRSATAPPVTVFRGSETVFRVQFADGNTASDISGLTPFMSWATNATASAVSTSSVSVVGSTTGLVDFTFSPASLNHDSGRYIYEVGVKTGSVARVYRQGTFSVYGSPTGAGVAGVDWTTELNWDDIDWVNLPTFATESSLSESGTVWRAEWQAGDVIASTNLQAAITAESVARAAGDVVALTNWQAIVYGMTNGAALGETAWQNPISASDWTWESDGTNVTLLTYTGPNDVVIPDKIDNLPVVSFGDSLSGFVAARIKSVTGGKYVTSIGPSALSGSSVTNVALLYVTSIGDAAFAYSMSLRSIFFDGPTIPSEGSSIYLGNTIVTNYVTNPTTGWGATLGGRPVVRLPLYADSATIGGVAVSSLTSFAATTNIVAGLALLTDGTRAMSANLPMGGNSVTGLLNICMSGYQQALSGPGTSTIDQTAYGASQSGLNAGAQTIGDSAYGASQSGYNYGTQTIGDSAYGASQSGLNAGAQTIGDSAYGASQSGYNYGTQTIGDSAYGASQSGLNAGAQTIGGSAYGASQSGLNAGAQTIGTDAYGASQSGYNNGTQTIGNGAFGANQSGQIAATATATNTAIGAMQLHDLTAGQHALTTAGGTASILLGAGIASNKNSIVAGDGNVSHGPGSITAHGLYEGHAKVTTYSAVTNIVAEAAATRATRYAVKTLADIGAPWYTLSSTPATGVVQTIEVTGPTNDQYLAQFIGPQLVAGQIMRGSILVRAFLTQQLGGTATARIEPYLLTAAGETLTEWANGPTLAIPNASADGLLFEIPVPADYQYPAGSRLGLKIKLPTGSPGKTVTLTLENGYQLSMAFPVSSAFFASAAELADHAAIAASPSVSGHVKVGGGLAIDGAGVLSASRPGAIQPNEWAPAQQILAQGVYSEVVGADTYYFAPAFKWLSGTTVFGRFVCLPCTDVAASNLVIRTTSAHVGRSPGLTSTESLYGVWDQSIPSLKTEPQAIVSAPFGSSPGSYKTTWTNSWPYAALGHPANAWWSGRTESTVTQAVYCVAIDYQWITP